MHRTEGNVRVFAYSVRKDWDVKLRADCRRISEGGHKPDVVVRVDARDARAVAATASERDEGMLRMGRRVLRRRAHPGALGRTVADLQPLIVALRMRTGETVRAPEEVLKVAADLGGRVEERLATGVPPGFFHRKEGVQVSGDR